MTTPQPPQPGLPYPPPQPPKKNNRTLIIVLAAVGSVLVLACIGCGILAAVGANTDDAKPPRPQPVPSFTAPATPTMQPTTAPTLTPSRTPTAPPVDPSPPEAAVPVPNLVGKNAAVADDELRRLGFTNIQYGSQDDGDKVVLLLTNWTVAKQSTKAGAKVPTDALIVLTCTKQ